MTFYLGIHQPNWLPYARVPTFVSLHALRGRYGDDLHRTLPRAAAPWCLDSGGFTTLNLHGTWTISPHQYAVLARRAADEIGQLRWIAPQDWMCEPAVLRRTGLTVREHQYRTLRSVLDMRSLDHGLQVITVVQGDTRDDYLRHVDEYARHGIALDQEPVVGVGSVCRRQATTFAANLFADLKALGLRCHGFGLKSGAALQHVASCDSMAWSFHARKKCLLLPECAAGIPFISGAKRPTHKNCANCLRYALQWRTARLSQSSFSEYICPIA